ncbi:MAG: hypothetical protein ACWA5P_04835 [bacterium]
MKNRIKFSLLALLIAVGFNSCTERDNVIDDVLDGVTNGAVLRTINVFSAEYALGSEGPTWGIEIEEQDVEDGDLLQSVNVYVSFVDESEGTTSNEVLYQTINADEFVDGPFGLPRTTINISLDEMLAANGITADDIFGGDTFPVRLELNLTDGRTFTNANTAGVVQGGFFNSPFLYNVSVVCAIPDDYFVGTYTVQRTSSETNPFIGCCDVAWDPNPQTVDITANGVVRNFTYPYFPNFFAFPQIISMQLSCGNIFFTGTAAAGSLGCGGGTITQGPGPVIPTYNLADDSNFTMEIEDFADDAGCGTGSYLVTLEFVKQ